jgi:hypothetical protein
MRVNLRLWLSAAVVFGLATSASAQILSWNLSIYQSPLFISAISVAADQVRCLQPAPASISTENPTTWVWDDAANPGSVCTYVDTRLAALPDGAYEGSAQAVSAGGASNESARAAFSIKTSAPPPPPPPQSGCTYNGQAYPYSDQLYTFSAKRQTQESVTTALTAGGWTILSPWRQVRGNNYLIDAVCVVK